LNANIWLFPVTEYKYEYKQLKKLRIIITRNVTITVLIATDTLI